MTGLRISDDLVLPLEAVTEPMGMFANRGKGKSNGAHRLVEELYRAGLPSIVLDVKGDWYGIRSSADGTKAGLPFLILGGSHADIVLEPGSGRQWARFLAEQRIPTIVDLSHFSKTQARHWVMEFAEELYRVNTEPLLLVVDEADVLIPQRLAAELMRLLGAMEDIAKRGRQRGLGILVISQRVADVNKSVTDLLETLLLFAVTGSRTRKAILEWIDDHADPDEAKAVVATLSGLEPGECWAWSPGWLRLLKRIRLLRPETFDSHATPAPGQRRRPIKTMADIDLSAVKETMAETIERAKAEDPKALQGRLRQLEKDLARAMARPAPAPEVVTQVVTETVEVAVCPPVLRDGLRETLAAMQALLAGLEELPTGHPGTTRSVTRSAPEAKPLARLERIRRPAPAPAAPHPPAAQPRAPGPEPSVSVEGGELPPGEAKILTAAAQYPAGVSREQLTVLTGYKQSSRNTYIHRLRQRGLVAVDGGAVLPTTAGLAALGDDFEPLPTGAALRAHWLATLPEGEKRILELLVEAYPAGVVRDELSERTGYKQSSRNTYLHRLRARQVITTSGDPRAADALFDSGGR